MMSIADILRYSLTQLKSKKLETFLVIFAVTLSVLVFNAILSPTYHKYKIKDNIEHYKVSIRPGRDLGSNFLINKPGLPITPYQNLEDLNGARLTLPFIEELCQGVPGVDFYLSGSTNSSILRGYTNISSFTSTVNYNAPGHFGFIHMTPDAMNGFSLKLKSGSPYTKDDFLNNRPYVILGCELAEKLFPNSDPVGKTVEFNNTLVPTLTVLGVFAPYEIPEIANYSIKNINQIAASSYVYLRFQENEINYPSVNIYPKESNLNLYKRINSYLEKHYPGVFTVSSLASSMESAYQDYERSYIALGLIAAFILLIACINIINLHFARIAKQQQTIGLNLALGATKKTIFFQYLVTSLIQGLTGGILGVLLLWLISLTKVSQTFYIIFNSQAVLYGITVGVLMSVIFGIYPAIIASQTSPVEALRME